MPYCIRSRFLILLKLWLRYANTMEDNCYDATLSRYTKGITFQYFFGTDRALKQLKRL